MALTPARHDVGGGSSHKSVVIRKEWADAISEAKKQNIEHFNARHWTDEENEFLVMARSVKMSWTNLCDMLKCNESTARKQWRKLTTK
jgi:hypothetical protein